MKIDLDEIRKIKVEPDDILWIFVPHEYDGDYMKSVREIMRKEFPAIKCIISTRDFDVKKVKFADVEELINGMFLDRDDR